MGKTHTCEIPREGFGSGHAAAPGATPGAADWLCLAAAPTFAVMALLTSLLGSGQPDILCSAMQNASPLGGMAPMYLLMAAFHLPPWLKLVSRRVRQPTCSAHSRASGNPG